VLFLLLIACNKDQVEESGLPAICNDGSAWATGEQAFLEGTADWGLESIAPSGVRVSAVDFDGDGWADLAVRNNMGGGTDEAPQHWLLRNNQAGAFEDVSESSGLRALSEGGATWVFGDVDNDGDLDIYIGVDNTTVDGASSQILLNNGDGTFAQGPSSEVALAGDRPYGAAFADVDGDGNLDLFVAQYGSAQDRLYKGDGAGSFSDVTADSGLTTQQWSNLSVLNNGEAHSNAWAAAACDLNNDGLPELLASSYGRAPNHLWLNSGGSFANQSVASGYAYDERMDWSDNQSAMCWCELHPTDPDCSGVPGPTLISCNTDADAFRWNHTYDREAFRLGGNSGGTTCGDVDNDGNLDLLTSEIVHWDVGGSSDPSELLMNTGDSQVVFERPGREAMGLTREYDIADWNEGDITGGMLDFDADGFLDVWIGSSDYPGTRGLLYHNLGDRNFQAVPVEQGIDHMRSHGSTVADFDHDGDLDMVVGHSRSRCDDDCYETGAVRLFINQSADVNSISLALEGADGSNASAIGARVEIATASTTQTRFVDGGHGQWGQQDDLTIFAGLGSDCSASVTVTWPDAARTTQTVELGGGYRYSLKQGGELKVLE
jgi:hypothetical protein